ncbi:MAG: adenylyl-sulfate kinase [Bacteroidetes bacterium]|nr:adenylyl-sulfate kinase [Bacteroidota bacterium]
MKKGFTIWLTGYSGSGKTTIASALNKELVNRNISCEILDGDVIRQYLSRGLTFSKEDRCENIMRIGFVAELLSRHGVVVIVSAISPYRSAREAVRNRIADFIEVYAKCPINVCEERDVKGLYKKARAGLVNNFTGISDPYEEPLNPEVVCETDTQLINESVESILGYLVKTGLLSVK